MRKNKFLKIALIIAIAICTICLFAKSFLAVHSYPEGCVTVNLMFKTNPLGDNFVGDRYRFDADMKSPLRICSDENMVIGENNLRFISKIPLPIYIFLLLLLVSIYAKMRNPKLKKRQFVIPTIAIPFLIGVIWLFQTYEPSKKIYSIDEQYSYYFEIYNFNKVKPISMFYTWDFGFAGVNSPSYYYKRKIFLYDEIEQKILKSEYIGDCNDIEHFEHKECFPSWDNTLFYFPSWDYKLPRPIDEKAIEQMRKQENTIRQENAINDSICWEQIKQEFFKLPAITQEELGGIQLVIKKWTDYYKMDFSQAKFIKLSDADFHSKPVKSVCNWEEFANKENSSSLPGVTYSPSKQRYIDINVSYKTVKGVHYYTGHEEWSIYLIDRMEKHKNHLFCEAPYHSIDRLHDVFWVNNDVFVIVGTNNSYCSLDVPCIKELKHTGGVSLTVYAIYVFDINTNTIREYGLLEKATPDIEYPYFEEYLKERGLRL